MYGSGGRISASRFLLKGIDARTGEDRAIWPSGHRKSFLFSNHPITDPAEGEKDPQQRVV
jgi:hypothetical protein